MKVTASAPSDWKVPAAANVSAGHVHEASREDLGDEILFQVHVQLRDRHGSTVVDWVVLRPFSAFWDLHTNAVRRSGLLDLRYASNLIVSVCTLAPSRST